MLDKLHINRVGIGNLKNCQFQDEISESIEKSEGENRRTSQTWMIQIWKHEKSMPIVYEIRDRYGGTCRHMWWKRIERRSLVVILSVLT